MAKEKLTGADFLLLLLYINNKSPIMGALRLTKMMFLFEKEIKPIINDKKFDIEKLAEFIPFNFGPFSKDLYEQIELFKNIKFISVIDLNSNNEMEDFDTFIEDLSAQDIDGNSKEYDEVYLHVLEKNQEMQRLDEKKFYKYEIKKLGIDFVEQKILHNINQETIKMLEKFKVKVNSLTIKEILYYVYSKYPEYTQNSIIKDEVLGE